MVYVDNDPVVLVHADALLAGDATVAVLLVAILHFLTDEDHPAAIVGRLREAMAPGSYLVISHGTADFAPELSARAAGVYDRARAPLVTRGRAEVMRFFDGFDLVDPGLVQVALWRPDGPIPDNPAWIYGGVGHRRR